MKACAVKGCPITRHNAPDYVVVHGFPKMPALKKKWLDQLQLSTASSCVGVCSFHFADDIKCWTWDKKMRLLHNAGPAMPTENLTEEEASKLIPGPEREPAAHPNKALYLAAHQLPKRVCRLCMKSYSSLSPLFNETEDEQECWANKIMKIADINISISDNRPSDVCIACQRLVEDALTLRKLTENSESVFAETDEKADEEAENKAEIKEERPIATIIRKTFEKKFNCDKCGNAFRSESILQAHKYIHTGERPFKCNQCTRGFTTQGFLIMHKRQLHTATLELPYKCDICDRNWLTEIHLKLHRRTHFEEQIYSCSLCDVAFDTPGALDLHKRSTHKPVESVYNCTICDYKSSNKYTVRTHMFRHTGEKPVQCEQCGRCFGDKHQLRLHIRTHTGERPYKCNVCDKRFTQKCSLNTHSICHTGIKKFLCSACGNSFKLRASLRTHQKNCKEEGNTNIGVDHDSIFIDQDML